MVHLRSKLTVADNSGVKRVRRIHVFGVRRRPGTLGHMVVATVRKSIPTCSMKRGSLVRGYLIGLVRGWTRSTGVTVRCEENSVILTNAKGEPLSTRVFVPLPSDLRRRGRSKRLSLGGSKV